jgi:hypothetical protein
LPIRSVTHRIPLQLRQLRQGVVLVRASNDTVADEYGTTITVEALMRDWWEGYRQHRTVSLQHNLSELPSPPACCGGLPSRLQPKNPAGT